MNTIYKTYRSLLSEVLSFQSVSTDDRFHDDMLKAVQWYQELFELRGHQVWVSDISPMNPIIVGEVKAGDNLPWVLVYGHYDVQPADQTEWKFNPFELSESDGRLIGRGVADNKGQLLIHLVSVFDLYKKGKLGYNVRFLIEGNEESGNSEIGKWLYQSRERLRSEFILISDGDMDETPSFEVSLRGAANIELTLKTASKEFHSGIFGGAILNASHELSILLSRFLEDDKPYLYSDVLAIEPEELDLDSFQEDLGDATLSLERGKSVHRQVGILPTIQITGMNSGYTSDGFKNSIPMTATAKINVRIGPGQNQNEILEGIQEHLRSLTRKGVIIEIVVGDNEPGWYSEVKGDFADLIQKRVVEVYGSNPKTSYCGGTLPIVNEFEDALGITPLLLGLANRDCGMHSAGENMRKDLILKNLELSQKIFEKSN